MSPGRQEGKPDGSQAPADVPPEVLQWAEQRQAHRQARRFEAADALRDRIEQAGWTVADTPAGFQLLPRPAYTTIVPSAIPDRRGEPDGVDVSMLLLLEGPWRGELSGPDPTPGHGPGPPDWVLGDAQRAAASVLRCAGGAASFEVLILDDGVGGEAGAWAAELARRPEVQAYHLAEPVGFARARALQQRAATGRVLLWLDTGVELIADPRAAGGHPTGAPGSGNALDAIVAVMDDPTIGAVGRWGGDLAGSVHAFTAVEPAAAPGVRDVDAVWGYLLGVRRRAVVASGVMPDEGFGFYRNVDTDLSFQLRAAGWRTVITDLPAVQHVHRGYSETPPEALQALSRRTYRRLLKRWRPQMQALVDARGRG